MLQADQIVLRGTADVIDQELGHPSDWAPMTNSNSQPFEVDLSEPTVAGLVSSLQDVGATVVKVSPGYLRHNIIRCHSAGLPDDPCSCSLSSHDDW